MSCTLGGEFQNTKIALVETDPLAGDLDVAGAWWYTHITTIAWVVRIMTKNEILAYLAGAMDSDGSFGIRRKTYSMRTRGDLSPGYSERVGLKQVTPEVPQLLKETFGGGVGVSKPGTKNSRPLWHWGATDRIAADAAKALLPFLRIKKRQVELLLELRSTKDDSRYQRLAYWFEKENPDWRDMPLLTFTEVAARMGYKSLDIVCQAVSNGSLLALPYQRATTPLR
jgi:hypothetical protein